MPHSAICTLTGQAFAILDQEMALCKTMNLPLPTLAPEERIRELMATRNERKLYHRKCDATGEQIISAYHADVPFPVYKNAIWWGGGWDARQYGREFDFSKPFFTQFAELQQVVPREGTSIFNSENCDFNSHTRNSKNCYMNSLVVNCEDAYYSYWVVGNKDIMDCMYTHGSELCYECLAVNDSYHCIMLEESENCRDSFFSYQLRGCNSCLFCTNLTNKSYHLWNKPCSKSEFERILQSLFNGSFETWTQAREKFFEMRLQTIQRALHNLNCENVSGDHLRNSRNLVNCFDGNGSEDCVHAVSLADSKNILSCYSAGWPASEMIYHSAVTRGCQDIAFGRYSWFSQRMRYCDSCVSCHDCFGCIGLHHREYCILNQQYTKEAYEDLIPKIITHMQQTGEWGRFFPPQLSPFAYNETSAQEYYPFSKEAATGRGYSWRDEEQRDFLPATFELPDTLAEVPDTIVNEVLACTETDRNYKIIPQELKFYRELNLPLPRLHPDIRHAHRLAVQNPKKIWKRNCAKCGVGMDSSFAPERPEIVYCERCYLEALQ